MSDSEKNKIVLAVQGSFGHLDYATGILDAFRAHNHAAKTVGEPTLDIAAASGCVEMLTPLALYLANQSAELTMRDTVLNEDKLFPPWAQPHLAAPAVRPDIWNSYFSGLFDAQSHLAEAGMRLFTHSLTSHNAPSQGGTATADLTAAAEDVAMYNSGLPGQIAFNPFYTAAKRASLEQLCADVVSPTLFTNATRANDLQEIYLYCGAEPSDAQKTAMRGKVERRQVLRLTPEYFFASGARPPYFAPIPVKVDGKTEHWMEGALRCNPPLSPLIDIDATHIVLIRFFSKENREEPNNNTELNERFLDAIFNIPLQKEIESIRLNNEFARCVSDLPKNEDVPKKFRQRREVVILDPADRTNAAASPAYIKFLNEELNALSHYDSTNPVRRAQMFDRGFEVGNLLIADLLEHLPTEVRLRAVG